jgi:hypothetical protein
MIKFKSSNSLKQSNCFSSIIWYNAVSVVPESLSSSRFMDAAVEIVDVVIEASNCLVLLGLDKAGGSTTSSGFTCALSPSLCPLPQTSKAYLSSPVEGVIS